ncbi:WD40-like Beta Propeller Repeat [Maribacter sedimenticola]|uniref:WD40-like Beta Propeller Repeat n=1 Tax=Maribacter sedimenticola TaxID=228956 RepID=A0ABY1SD55_9FLAO|nr:OmpA family protein [Maribacter sedimenticola]SNR26451.1 WD40-like Beta Propeller Repeat [Maribacter sedimenticola]
MTERTNYVYFLFLAIVLVGAATHAQDRKLKSAQNEFKNYAYAEAIEAYEQLVEDGYETKDIYKNLGDSYYQKADYNAAAHWYGQLFALNDSTVEAEYEYRYAHTLKSVGDYKASNEWMKTFSANNPQDLRAIKFLEDTQYLENIKAKASRYDIKNVAINSPASDFAPSLKGSELVFSTARDSGKISKNLHKWNNRPFSNLYSATVLEDGTFTEPMRLSKKLNKKTHETSTAFTKDGKTVYFTRNNSKNGNFARDDKGLSRLKIYKATLQDGEWMHITELPFNSDNYSVAHPTLSADERKMYFASDMPGTYGKSDIFVVEINEDGSFGTPKNLGNQVNTESRETFPHITQENILYFASDGHPGLGGLDVFATRINDHLDQGFVVNVGEPVNSEQDDFSFVIDENSKTGFFASNREGGVGSDDIYSFKETEEIVLECQKEIKGIVSIKDTGKALQGAKITLYDNKDNKVAESISGKNGGFNLVGPCGTGTYRVEGAKLDFEKDATSFTWNGTKVAHEIALQLAPVVKTPSMGSDLTTFLGLSPIYFDLDKSFIRQDAITTLNEVIAYMKQYPEIKIEVRSHTDASAGTAYNLRLSERRVKATMAYLEENGINKARLSGHGFGETQLLNDCVTKDVCNDAQHQINRRSEFIVVE